MPVFLFWNTKKRDLSALTSSLVQEFHADVVILAECPEDSDDPMLTALQKADAAFGSHKSLTDKVRVYSRIGPSEVITPIFDAGGLSMRRVNIPSMQEVLLAAVHLPSKLYQTEAEQSQHCTQLATYIREREAEAGHARTIVVGDFNMNPFEVGVVGFDGFHAVMSRRIASRTSRQIYAEKRRFFYNPMWSLFGDRGDQPPGTYYRWDSKRVSYFWHMFDQVLVSADLVDAFRVDQLKIPTGTGDTSFLNQRDEPDPKVASDHLPILFALDL